MWSIGISVPLKSGNVRSPPSSGQLTVSNVCMHACVRCGFEMLSLDWFPHSQRKYHSGRIGWPPWLSHTLPNVISRTIYLSTYIKTYLCTVRHHRGLPCKNGTPWIAHTTRCTYTERHTKIGDVPMERHNRLPTTLENMAAHGVKAHRVERKGWEPKYDTCISLQQNRSSW